MTTRPTIDEIWRVLEAVPDPEIPVISVVDLGIVRDVEWRDDGLQVIVTPTYSGCPATRVISEDITKALQAHGIANPIISTRISPPWTTDWLTDAAREKIERYGIAPPNSAKGPKQCPRCKSNAVELISQFGSTPCKAHWRCKSCLEPFDYFKCI